GKRSPSTSITSATSSGARHLYPFASLPAVSSIPARSATRKTESRFARNKGRVRPPTQPSKTSKHNIEGVTMLSAILLTVTMILFFVCAPAISRNWAERDGPSDSQKQKGKGHLQSAG